MNRFDVPDLDLKEKLKPRRHTTPCDECSSNNNQDTLQEITKSCTKCNKNEDTPDEFSIKKERRLSKTKWFDQDDENQNDVTSQNDENKSEIPDEKSNTEEKRNSTSSEEVIIKNTLYASVNKTEPKNERSSEIIVYNTEYISNPGLETEKRQSTTSIDSYHYIENVKEPNDAEYYCTYQDIQHNHKLSRQSTHIYHDIEPSLPPRHHNVSESEEKGSNSSKEEKQTRLQKLKQKFKNRSKVSLREKSSGLFKFKIGKKKETVEDDVEYAEPEDFWKRNEKIKDLANGPQQKDQVVLVQALVELQQKLEIKKEEIKVRIFLISNFKTCPFICSFIF